MNLLTNGLVRELQPASQALLCARCIRVELNAGEILSSPQKPSPYVYFLTGATVALVVRDTSNPDASGLAVGLTGREGAIGLQQALGLGTGVLTMLVQSGGSAWQLEGNVLLHMVERNVQLMRCVGRYLWTVSQEIATTAARAQMHGVHNRLAAWLVLSALRGDIDRLHLTHVHLADMLGVRRASITDAALQLKDRGLLDYKRGQIRILNLPGLQFIAQNL